MGYPSVKPFVMEYMMANPGRHITKQEIADALQYDGSQVNNAIGTLICDDKVEGLYRVVRGSIYRYDPPGSTPNVLEAPAAEDALDGSADGPWYEQVGSTSKGAPIVRSSDGTLYRLEAL